MRRTASRLVILLAVLSLVSLPLYSQTVTGTINGTVTDRSGASLPGVTVTIRNIETGLERIVVTGNDGFFNAPFLPVGKYTVSSELSGFGTIRRENIRVELNQTTVQDFMLDPAMSETVVVAADAPRINVTDGEIKQTMRSEEIMTLPQANQTSFLGLAALFTGYMENPTSGQDNPTLSSGSSVNFNGAGTRGTTFQINGVNNDDSSENQHRQGVALATIKSFQVLTNSYSSEFGRGYGAVVLVQTKSGTNDIDGEVYGYGTDNRYRTRDVLQVSLDHGDRHRYQYGATAGFPILRDRLFGYANIDRVDDEGTVTQTRGVFLASDLDPSKRLTLGNDTPANRAWQDAVIARFPQGPPNATNVASRGYQGLVLQNFPDRDASARLDWNVSLNNNLTARYQRSRQIREPGEIIFGEAANQDNRQSNFGLTFTNIFTSNTVQEGRIGIGLRSTNVNISGGNDTPVVRMSGGTGLTFTILGNAGAFPILRNQRDNQLVYNISTARWSRHTLKVGMDLRRSSLDDRADNFNRGFWNFGATCGGVNYGTSIAAFWAGCVTTYTVAYGPNYLENDLREENFYVQDDWRPFDNLTLNIGARFENVGAPEEAEDRIDYQMDATQYLDPRLGFAYTPNWDRSRFLRAITGGNGRFSIRGGFGVYHGRVFQSVFSQGGASIRSNPPNAASLGFSNSTNLADPTNGFVFVPGQPAFRVTITTVDPELVMPESRQWNLTFERQTFWDSRLRFSYIGAFGMDLLQYRAWNLPVAPAPPGTQGAAWVVAEDWRCAGTGRTGAPTNTTCPNTVPLADNEVSLRFPRYNERRPDARYGTNLEVANLGESWYHAGQAEWELGNYKGVGGRITYTFSKAIDSGSEATSVGDVSTGDVNIFPPNDAYKRGLSRMDTRHRFTLLGSYALPWLKERDDWTGSLFGGWVFSTVVRLASGNPFTITDSGAPDIDFDSLANQRPVCVDSRYCGGWHVTGPKDPRIPSSAFRHPVYGDSLEDLMPRNTYYTDGKESVDMGLYKNFKLPAAMTLMVRFDVFNVFNQVTWWYPNADFNTGTFGVVNRTNYGPRSMQLGLRMLY
jgi:hypothetical protein